MMTSRQKLKSWLGYLLAKQGALNNQFAKDQVSKLASGFAYWDP